MTDKDSSSSPPRSLVEVSDKLEQALFEIRRIIAGQDAMLERGARLPARPGTPA